MQKDDKGNGRQGMASFSNNAVQELSDDSISQSISEAVTENHGLSDYFQILHYFLTCSQR